MTSQKLENLLNLALNSAEDEREKSLNLNVGYDPLDREWDLIQIFRKSGPSQKDSIQSNRTSK